MGVGVGIGGRGGTEADNCKICVCGTWVMGGCGIGVGLDMRVVGLCARFGCWGRGGIGHDTCTVLCVRGSWVLVSIAYTYW